MHLTLSPVRGLPGQPETLIHVAGDVLTVDGTPYDLSAIPADGEATPEGDTHPFIGVIHRHGATIHCTLRTILGDDAARDQPESPWVIDHASGLVTIPAQRIAREPEDEGNAGAPQASSAEDAQ